MLSDCIMSFYNPAPPPAIGFNNLIAPSSGLYPGLPSTYPPPPQPSYPFDQPLAPGGYAGYPPGPGPQGPSYGYPTIAGSGFPVPDFVSSVSNCAILRNYALTQNCLII